MYKNGRRSASRARTRVGAVLRDEATGGQGPDHSKLFKRQVCFIKSCEEFKAVGWSGQIGIFPKISLSCGKWGGRGHTGGRPSLWEGWGWLNGQ